MWSISPFPLLSICAPNQDVGKSFLANKPFRRSPKQHCFSSIENADFSCRLLQSFYTFRIYPYHITQGLLELATPSELLLFMETLNEMLPSTFSPEIFLMSSVCMCACVWIYTSHKKIFFGHCSHLEEHIVRSLIKWLPWLAFPVTKHRGTVYQKTNWLVHS